MEWINANVDIVIWIIIAVTAGIAEAVTAATVSIWFVIGAAAALGLAFLGVPGWIQFVAFLAISGVCIKLVRKSIAGNKQKSLEASPNVTDGVVGKTAVVTLAIEPFKTGQIKVNGLQWTAKAIDESEAIPLNAKVTVMKVEGICCIVDKFDETL